MGDMMFKIFITIFLFVTTTLLSNSYQCHAEKKLLIYNAETGSSKKYFAKTPSFDVTNKEHEDAKTLLFFDAARGKQWGKVDVSTGAFINKEGKNYFHANATMTDKDDQNIVAFLTLRFSAKTKDKIDTTTIIFDPAEEMSPSLSLVCSKKAN